MKPNNPNNLYAKNGEFLGGTLPTQALKRYFKFSFAIFKLTTKMNLIDKGIELGLIKLDKERNFITYIHQNKKRNYNNTEEKVQAETFLTLVIIRLVAMKWVNFSS